MIDLINSCGKCHQIIANTLEEEGIRIKFGATLTDKQGDMDTNVVAILKPDKFYNTKNFATPPKSVDGVIVVSSEGNTYIYVAELKSSRLKNINKQDIQEKFSTVFNIFFKCDFKHIFVDQEYFLKNISLWLVCDPTNIRKFSHDPGLLEQKMKASLGLRGMLADYSASLLPYRFKGKIAQIRLTISPPTIEKDHYTEFLDNFQDL